VLMPKYHFDRFHSQATISFGGAVACWFSQRFHHGNLKITRPVPDKIPNLFFHRTVMIEGGDGIIVGQNGL